MSETIVESPGIQKIRKEVERLMKTTLRVVEDNVLQVELITKLLEVRKALDGKRVSED